MRVSTPNVVNGDDVRRRDETYFTDEELVDLRKERKMDNRYSLGFGD